jgi:uncharacterized protein (UPF0371 family)
MLDYFHLEAYGETTVNYNRDIEIYPVLAATFEKIYGSCPYKSPTDMGVNMVGNCIIDEEVVAQACRDEIVRRYYQTCCDKLMGRAEESAVIKIESIMQQADVTTNERRVVKYALDKAKQSDTHAVAIEFNGGTIVTGKSSSLLGSVSAALLNAMKVLAGIPDDVPLLAQAFIEPIVRLKKETLRSGTSHLNSHEMLIALSSSAAINPQAQKALDQIPLLRGAQLHSSVMLGDTDEKILKKLGLNCTSEPIRREKKVY